MATSPIVSADSFPDLRAAFDGVSDGATLFIPPGNYVVSGPLNGGNKPLVLRAGMRVIGAGIGHTVLTLPDNVAQTPRPGATSLCATLIINDHHAWWHWDPNSGSAPPDPIFNLELAHMTLDGNGTNQNGNGTNLKAIDKAQARGLVSLNNVGNIYFHDLDIVNSIPYGLELQSNASTPGGGFGVRNAVFERVATSAAQWDGIALVGVFKNLTFRECSSYDNARDGVHFEDVGLSAY